MSPVAPGPDVEAGSPVRLIGWMCTAELLSMVGVFAFPALLPDLVAAWRLSNTDAGWINGVYFAGYAAAVPLLASLTDRVDGRRVYLFGAAAAALGSAGFAFLANGFGTALVFRALSGLGLAGTFVPGLKALVDRVPPPLQPRAVTVYTAAFGLGTSLSFYAAGEIGRLLGWRPAFGAAAVAALLAFALVARVLRPVPPLAAAPGAPALDFRPVLRNRRAVAYILAYSGHTWELFSLRAWGVAFLTASLGFSGSRPGSWSPTVVAALAGLAATAANMACGELCLRVGRRRVITALMAGAAVLAAGTGFLAGQPYPLVAGVWVLYNLLVQADSSGLHMGTVGSADPARRGTTMALQSLAGFTTASLGPLAVGVALDLSGAGATPLSWGIAFLVTGGVAALGPLALRLAGPEGVPAPGNGPAPG